MTNDWLAIYQIDDTEAGKNQAESILKWTSLLGKDNNNHHHHRCPKWKLWIMSQAAI